MNKIQTKVFSVLKKIRRVLFREKYVFLSFCITWLALMALARKSEIAPFGENSLLAMDLYGQYYPMMWEKLSDLFSVWSWNGALGFSSVAQSAYYTNSIFLLLMLPFSGYARIAALDMMIFLKIALCASAFSYYLGKKFEKCDIFTAVFGVAYALGAYTVAFMNQPMWLDIVLLLPLIMSALDSLIEGKSPIPYALWLALAIFSNFYISWALCLFVALWFIASVLMRKRSGFRDLAKISVKFAAASLCGGLLCAFMLVPLLLQVENWISSSIGFAEGGEWYHGLSEIVDSFSCGGEPSLEFGPANVFCGSAALFLAFIFILNAGIPFKRRLAVSLLAVILFVSFEWNLLDFIWHGLHFPNQLPGRQSFLFIFVILTMGYEALICVKGLGFAKLIFSGSVSAGFFLLGIGKSQNAEGRLISIAVVAAVFVLMTLLLVVKNRPLFARVTKVMIAVVLLAEICINAVAVLALYGKKASALTYIQYEEQMLFYAKKYQSGENAFYRTEMSPPYTFNCGQLYGFKGITYYSSTMNGKTYTLMENLGNRVYAQNVSTVYMPTPLQDMMFDVKYHYMHSGKNLSYGTRLEKVNGISVYESPYALSVAYAVDAGIKEIESVSQTGLRLQEKFVRLATDGRQKLLYEAEILNAYVSNGVYRNGCLYVRDAESAATYTLEMAVCADGYFYLDFDFKVGTYEVTVNEGKPKTGHCGADQLLDLGYMTYGDRVTVTVTTKGYTYVRGGVQSYTIEENALYQAYKKLSQETLRVEYASDTEIRGEITLAEDGVLYASIPAENGWEVYIDGEKTETYDLGLGLLFCDVEAGTHTVEYRYRAPGLALGIVISAMTAAFLVGYFVFKKRYYG